MNFLGHLYFSNNDMSLMYANLYGDYIKGKDLSAYGSKIQYGIKLHREIDSFVDNHPAVRELLHLLYPSLPKVSGIAVDLFFDHLLAKNWDDYSSESLETFVTRFNDYEPNFSQFQNEEFQYMLMHMKRGQWLLNYKHLEGLQRSCEGLSRRISFRNTLFTGRQIFEENETFVVSAFTVYMHEAIPHFKKFHLSHRG